MQSTVERRFEIIENKLNQNLDEIENRFKKFDNEITDFKNSVISRLDVVEEKLNKNQSEVKNIVEDKIQTIQSTYKNSNETNEENLQRVKSLEEKINLQNENSEKERRAKNLIFYNVPESISEEAEERMADDCKKLKNIFERNKFTIDPEKIETIFRLGKRENGNGKARPILIKLSNLEYKKEMLKYCKYLNYIADNLKIPIYFSHDLTIKEREKRKQLLMNCNKKKTRKQ